MIKLSSPQKTKLLAARIPESLDKAIWDFAVEYCESNQSESVRFLCEFALMLMNRLDTETIKNMVLNKDL